MMIKAIAVTATIGTIGTVAATAHLTTPILTAITIVAVVAAVLVIAVVRMLLQACHRTSSTQPGSFDVSAFTAIIDAVTRLVRGQNSISREIDPPDTTTATSSRRRRRERRWTLWGLLRRRSQTGNTDPDRTDSTRR